MHHSTALAMESRIKQSMADLIAIIKSDNARWWVDPGTGVPLERNVGEMLALVHSEISEALEGDRTSAWDKHLPHRKNFQVELADALIRILDIAAHVCPGIEHALFEKLAFNRTREDHKPENRLRDGGKKY